MFYWFWSIFTGAATPAIPAHGDSKLNNDNAHETGHAKSSGAVPPSVALDQQDDYERIDHPRETTTNQGVERTADKTTSFQAQGSPKGSFADIPNLTGLIQSMSEFPDHEATHSNVHKAKYKGENVAVKIFRGRGVTAISKQRLMSDLRVWIKFSHKNILPLYGYCHDLGKQGALVSPWYENGNVGHYIRPQDPSRRVAPSQRFNLWCDVIGGLAYLHTKGVVHGDLKPTNVLVDNEGTARVCDFALATIFSEGMVGATPTPVHSSTMRYLAYELIVAEDTAIPTKASDIYAVGCLALEIIFLISPYANRRNPAQIFRDVAKGDSPAQSMPIKGEPPPILQELWNTLNACWNISPEKRPSAQQLKAFVDENRDELTLAVGLL